jgi:hypothetical protein
LFAFGCDFKAYKPVAVPVLSMIIHRHIGGISLELVSNPHLMPECCVANRLKIYGSSASGGLRFLVDLRLAFDHDLVFWNQFQEKGHLKAIDIQI